MRIIGLIFLLLIFSCNEEITYSPVTSYPEIPQGKMIFDLSQYSGQINTQVEVVIEGNNITVYNSKTNPLTGGKVIVEGILLKHISGQWIIGNDESDKTREEIGGCTGGPTPIDFESKVIEWC